MENDFSFDSSDQKEEEFNIDEFINPRYFVYRDTDEKFYPSINGDSTLRFSFGTRPYDFNSPPDYVLIFNYWSRDNSRGDLSGFGIKEEDIEYYLDKYPYLMQRVPLIDDENENEQFLRLLFRYHKSEEGRTLKSIVKEQEECKVVTTIDLLNFHLRHYTGSPLEFIRNITTILNSITDESFIVVQLKKKVNGWITEIEKDFISNQQMVNSETADHPQIIKLPWNGTSSSLYHLFAQLLDTQSKKGKLLFDHTPESVAAFLLQSFSVSGNANKDTVERAIQSYMKGEKDSADGKPPKDALNLDGIDFDAE